MHTGSGLRVNRLWAGGALVLVIGVGLADVGMGGCSVDNKGLNANADAARADAADAGDRGPGTGGRGGTGGLTPIGTGGGGPAGSGGRLGSGGGGGGGAGMLGSGGDTAVGTGGGDVGTGGDTGPGTGGAGTGGAGTGGAGTGGAGTGGAGTGGRMGTGGDGTMGGCNANTCPDGCCNGAMCVTNRTNQRCGTAGAACSPCGACYQCSANTGSCTLTPSARWDLLCASATIPPTKPGNVVWDSTTGPGPAALPDPFCHFALESSGPGNGQQGRTSVRMDTLSPMWNQSVVPPDGAAITHNVLVAQPTRWSVSVTDDDGSPTADDPLCTFSPRLTAADFAAGAVTLSGQNCLSLTIHLVCAED